MHSPEWLLPPIVLLVIVQACKIRAVENPDARQYTLNFHEAFPEPPKNFLRQTDSR